MKRSPGSVVTTVMKFQEYTYLGAADPLFVQQYSHAWIDFRGRRETAPTKTDWFESSVIATWFMTNPEVATALDRAGVRCRDAA